jgi:hypothetical protein
MRGPAGVPDFRPAQSAGPNAEPPHRITWQELGDAVYLASARRQPEPPPPAPQDKPPGYRSGPPPAPRPRQEHHDQQDRHGRLDEAVDRTAAYAEIENDFLTRHDDEPETWQEPELRVVSGDRTEAIQSAPPTMLEYFRALRPLKRKVPSRSADDLVVDEQETADQAAETGIWWPVTRRSEQRWLDLTLVVDANALWTLWQSQITTFVGLLEQLGAFRSVQVRLLDTDHNATPVLRGMQNSIARDPAEVLDPSGRRIILVLTDGVHEAWRKDLYGPVLAKWGRVMPVALVHLLPQWVWRRGGLGVHQAQLSVPGELRSNAQWNCRIVDDVIPESASIASADTVPIPIVEMHPRWLRWWTGLITGSSREPKSACVLLSTDEPQPLANDGGGPYGTPPLAMDVVKQFRSVASAPAQRLATLLAALPVEFSVLELLRDHFVPEAGPADIAELFISGLIRPDQNGLMRPDQHERRNAGSWTFPAGVREHLLSQGRRSLTTRVVREVATRLNDRFRVLGHLRDAIADPHGTPDLELTLETLAYVELEGAIMRSLSGPYLSRADRIRHVLQHDKNSVKKAPPNISASDPMSDPGTESTATATTASTQPAVRPQYDDTKQDEPLALSSTHALPPPSRIHKRLPEDPPPVWGNVPPRNPNFTGRQEPLEQLGKRLTAGGTAAVLPSALHGMGGIGKTQIATEYIYRHLQDYDLIWWIDAARETQIRASLTELAKQLGLQGSHEAHSAIAAVREALRTGPAVSSLATGLRRRRDTGVGSPLLPDERIR